MRVKACSRCGSETALPGAMCRTCAEQALMVRCKNITCWNDRLPGRQFCRECLENSSPEELKEALFYAFLQGMRVPQEDYAEMSRDAQEEIQKEFCNRVTLQYAGPRKRRFWRRVRRTAIFWLQTAAMVVLAWAALVITIGLLGD